MPNASQTLLRAKSGKVAASQQPAPNWLLRRVIADLAREDEFRWSAIEAEYDRRLKLIARVA